MPLPFESKSLKHTIISMSPLVRVSTAKLARQDIYGNWWLIETWIFSDDPEQFNRQIIHKTDREALKVHDLIVHGLRFKYLKLWNKRRAGVSCDEAKVTARNNEAWHLCKTIAASY